MSPSNVAKTVALRLALASGNQCAFPGCGSLFWYSDPDLLLGEICHIKGSRPGAKRYDPDQSNGERHSLHNLVFLCRNHHAEVDNDEETYTVERLQDMKREHEASVEPTAPPPDSTIGQLSGSVGQVRIEGDHNVTSINQMGGQTARSIINEGPQPRRIYRTAGDALVTELRKHSPEHFQISWTMDAESGELGAVLRDLLQQGGRDMKMEVSGAMLSGILPRGVIVETTLDTGGVNTLVEWMSAAGLNPQVNEGQKRFGILMMDPVPVHIVVGVLPQ